MSDAAEAAAAEPSAPEAAAVVPSTPDAPSAAPEPSGGHFATGEQFSLRFAGARGLSTAVVTELAASLRELVLQGIHSVETHSADVLPLMGSGLVLVPWPNRIADARWQLNGKTQQLDITEPATGNAIHGLLRNTAYRLVQRTESSITLAARVFPQHGYPFLLDTSVEYALSDEGLTVTHTLVNRSADAAPVAVGAHPYLRVGGVLVDDLVVTVAAGTQFEVDARSIPTAEVNLDGSPFDLRRGRRVGDLAIDHGYGDVAVVEGRSTHSVTAPDGSATELWGDENFGYVQVYTPNNFPREQGPGYAVAIEPMTAPANAFNSGRGLRWLAPGESWSVRWGIRHRPA
ncbi:aldose 1-epimerase family protein [Subtercola lobariae]|uniref:Aldose 1-epimerase n=1 Tax=Subtercola lobariae TaxID=1588641 RepID=A0A917B2V6_9MICO|nr:aldose 1-epimerase family protein [Subtercola lobariae]GGF19728.1 aldose 1-epimerase [Subtercola lobariae]